MFVFFFFPQLLSTSLKCTFEFTGMSIAQSSRESQLLRASESLYLISTSFFFFYTSQSTWHTTECAATPTCPGFNIRGDRSTRCLCSVDYKARERSRTCAKPSASYHRSEKRDINCDLLSKSKRESSGCV